MVMVVGCSFFSEGFDGLVGESSFVLKCVVRVA